MNTQLSLSTPAETMADSTSMAADARFRLAAEGYATSVFLGAFGVLRFDSMLSRIDPQGTLRVRIVAALNADPTLADAIKAATFAVPAVRP